MIKVVPAQNHFIEVREAFNIDEYSNENVIEHFKKNFEIIDNINVSKTFTVDSNQLSLLLKMTPVTFNIDLDKVENIDIDKISVAANILIGKKK